jgi:hypothetical protein
MFIRGFDAGKGVDVGRLVGLHQDSQNIAHLHDVNDPLHTHLWGNGAQGFGLTPGNWGAYSQGGSGNLSTTASATGISIQSSGGSEARPRNIALLMYLKY